MLLPAEDAPQRRMLPLFPQIVPSVPYSTDCNVQAVNEASMHGRSGQLSQHTGPNELEFRLCLARTSRSHCPPLTAAPSTSSHGGIILSSSNGHVGCGELVVQGTSARTKSSDLRYLLQTDRARETEGSNVIHMILHIKQLVRPQVSWQCLPARLNRTLALTQLRPDSWV